MHSHPSQLFFYSILSIFFSSMEVLGKENIPEHGPIIFTGNHMNQFVDAAVMVVANPHRVRFLIAEKSFNTRVVGDLARAIGSIPVVRPQDTAKRGLGKVRFEGLRLLGQGTSFTTLKKGDKLRPGRSANAYKIKTVLSDTEAELGEELGEASPLDEVVCQVHLRSHSKESSTASVSAAAASVATAPATTATVINSNISAAVSRDPEDCWVDFDILEFIDQGKVFEKVHSALAQGSCIGIFPEGGSHDNTDLLPLKVGVAAIAFGVLDKFDVTVPIVPVGLNYFRGHRFRGRVVVEFGQPIYLDKALIQKYKESKREAFNALLGSVRDGMRSVIVAASDYSELKLIHTVRRLYQRPSSGITTGDKQDLARRFSVGLRVLLEQQRERSGYNTLPEDLRVLQKKLEEYQDALTHWGLKDYQVTHLKQLSFSKMLYNFVHGCFIIGLASIPSIILNAPVGLAASYWATKQAQKDLKASRVKVAARDVLLSKKIHFSLIAVPTLWISYALLLCVFTSLSKTVILAMFLSCPFFSYLGVMAVEAGMVDIKDLRPAFLRLLPSFRQEMERLPAIRANLQREVRQITKKYGPEVGAVYYGKASEWEKEAHSHIKALSVPSQHRQEVGPQGADGGGALRGSNDELEGSRVKTSISSVFASSDRLLEAIVESEPPSFPAGVRNKAAKKDQ